MAFTFTFRKSSDSQEDAHPPFDLRRDGVGYADLTTPAQVEAAVATGRIERVPLIPPRFGGSIAAKNMICAAPGTSRALAWIEERVYRHFQNGDYVTYRAELTWQGASEVPAAMTIETGQETVTLHFWCGPANS